MDTAQDKKRRSIYGYIIFSIIFLFNPNISVIDVLPDFIAYFVLARAFLYASDCAPHFEEARIAFKRLGWLNFFKVFGLLVMLLVKRENASDNDVIPLVTLIFAICEVLLTFIAIKHLFDGLFYLGNRGETASAITPFTVAGKSVRPEDLRTLSYFFTGLKCLAYFAPTPFLLTNVNLSASGRASLVKGFVTVLIISQIVCIIVGIIWLIYVRKYALAIRSEGKFFSTLDTLLENNKGFSLAKKEKLRHIISTLTVFEVSSLFTLELALVENYDVNLIPHFIYAALLLYGVYRLSRYASYKIPTMISGIAYLAVSTVTYIFQTRFLTEYGYARLVTNKEARELYPTVTVLSLVELVTLLIFLFFIFRMLKSFITSHTGINEDSASLKANETYYGRLIRKNLIFFIAGAVAGTVKLISVILHGSVKIIYADNSEELMSAIVSPAVEWIGLAVAVSAFVYIGVTLYFFSTLKEEVSMRYEDEATKL